MLTSASWHDPVLINSIGHTSGLLVFGLIIALLIRDWRLRGPRQSGLSLIAALLALAWNAGSLIAVGSRVHESRAISFVMTASFATLSLLPAVLLQVVARGQHKRLIASGYAVSSAAVALHFSELFVPSAFLHQAALVVIALGFGLLATTLFLFQKFNREPKGTQKVDWMRLGCLFLFSASFLHFGYQHVNSPWSAEITWHHLGIPAALVILLQDCRFLLLDAFVRFIVNVGLAALYVLTLLAIVQRFGLSDIARISKYLEGIIFIALCLSLLLFAYLRYKLQRWVGRAIFRRSDLESAIDRIRELTLSVESEQELIARAAEEVVRYLRADHFEIVNQPIDRESRREEPSILFLDEMRLASSVGHFRPEAQIPLRFSSGERCCLLAGPRQGGLRYLSEDLEAMRRLGAAIVGQVERFRAEELKRLASQAELRALQAQINPHFLFNALNTLYGTIDRKSSEARRMVLNLAELLRYLLQNDRSVIQLSEELRIVRAYLEIESLRLGERLETQLSISETANSITIPVLSLQPLVENAVKHGIESKSGRGKISLRVENVNKGTRISVSDTGLGFEQTKEKRQNGTGVGLANVRRRLMLCYGPEADLEITSSDIGTTVAFLIPSNTRIARMAVW